VIPVLALVIPCFNEEEVLLETSARINKVLTELISISKISSKSFIVFVDDGSIDETWKIIKGLSETDIHRFRGLRLTSNFGHQNALLAGLEYVNGQADCIISIDADLQQDENEIGNFINKFKEGFEIVYGVRKNRDSDKFFKRTSATFFYNLMKFFRVKIIKNHADYRLISGRVLNSLLKYGEINLFLRGIFPTLGYKSTVLEHSVMERFAGKSKYTLRKMLSFALNGITSFSVTPIRFVSLIGFLVFFASIIMAIYVSIVKIMGVAVVGWASTLIPIYFIGGVQLLSLGLIGEYLGKVYLEVKRRPRYLINEHTYSGDNHD